MVSRPNQPLLPIFPIHRFRRKFEQFSNQRALRTVLSVSPVSFWEQLTVQHSLRISCAERHCYCETSEPAVDRPDNNGALLRGTMVTNVNLVSIRTNVNCSAEA
ncbi:hypothetical protein RB195_009891 [Necator americanus]|uniref:Phlebovirus glycoprotein G2 fusion domain-containing protein n=1 Tax=Necator americanus TaxID=51031 RepID=A0ABR1CYQ5_NECAM